MLANVLLVGGMRLAVSGGAVLKVKASALHRGCIWEQSCSITNRGQRISRSKSLGVHNWLFRPWRFSDRGTWRGLLLRCKHWSVCLPTSAAPSVVAGCLNAGSRSALQSYLDTGCCNSIDSNETWHTPHTFHKCACMRMVVRLVHCFATHTSKARSTSMNPLRYACESSCCRQQQLCFVCNITQLGGNLPPT